MAMKSHSNPIRVLWDGSSFKPISDYVTAICSRTFDVGNQYDIVEYQERSQRSHNHYFAMLTAVHDNLPDELAEKIPTVEHLRKFALIRSGYFNSRSIATSSNEQAQELAAFVKPLDEFSIIMINENIVTVFTAISQSKEAMGKKKFQESKERVLAFACSLIDTTVDDLKRNFNKIA